MDEFTVPLGIVADIIGIITFVAALWLIYKTRQEYRRRLRELNEGQREGGWILSVGIGGDISGSVKHYLESANLSRYPLKNLSHDGVLDSDNYDDMLRQLLRVKDDITQSGATEVHLFYKGPVTLALAIGAIFDNWLPIKVYGFVDGQYRLDMVLNKGTVLGLKNTDIESFVRTIAEEG